MNHYMTTKIKSLEQSKARNQAFDLLSFLDFFVIFEQFNGHSMEKQDYFLLLQICLNVKVFFGKKLTSSCTYLHVVRRECCRKTKQCKTLPRVNYIHGKDKVIKSSFQAALTGSDFTDIVTKKLIARLGCGWLLPYSSLYTRFFLQDEMTLYMQGNSIILNINYEI